jgi:GNAT superfamily N-acetyltransferase
VAGSLDVLLAWEPGRNPASDLAVREVEPSPHPRVDRALRWRRELRVYEETGGRGIVLLGRGVAGRLEVSVEVAPGSRSRGLARGLVGAALREAAPTEPVFAQVAAAHAASLRALSAAGFTPVGAEVLYGPPEDFLKRWTDGQIAPG